MQNNRMEMWGRGKGFLCLVPLSECEGEGEGEAEREGEVMWQGLVWFVYFFDF